MSKYSSSEWYKDPHHADDFHKECNCHGHGGCKGNCHGHDGCKGNCHGHGGCKGNCHGHGGCKGNCHGHGGCKGNCHGHGGCKGNCHGHGGCKGHCDDHHHGPNCKSLSCHHGACRRFICDDDFRFRLGGLHNGLNFRLRQLIGCHAEVSLEDGKTVHGKICHVGSNFVEMMMDQYDDKDKDDDDAKKDDKKPKKKDPCKKKKDPDEKEKDPCPKREHQTVIFSLDKINHFKHHFGCPGPCGCK